MIKMQACNVVAITPNCDVVAFGSILYEVKWSRIKRYEGLSCP